jgi:hypothetical protein
VNSYLVLKTIHKVGHPISGIVKGYNNFGDIDNYSNCHIEVETDSVYKSILTEWREPFVSKDQLPPIGSRIDMVVRNHVDDILYLSNNAKDLKDSTIKKYQDFYHAIESLEEGMIVEGKVAALPRFGIFVDLDIPSTIGLIDIGHTSFNGGIQLPQDTSKWPKVGDSIRCRIAYFRFCGCQIGLGWLPD